MPRPGPRPYECLRRAWHSERHQPMRGNIIQQIFRIVSGFHSSVTKRNREWQDKLPAVVFKAEEIMYSKANSEEEYNNLETLSDRVNNAVDLIIRRDETTETGDFIPPCVEAALNLGCIPVKASRSQRHIISSCYLGGGYAIQNPLSGNPNPPFPEDRFPRLNLRPFENRNAYFGQGMTDFGFLVSECGQSTPNDSPPCVNSSVIPADRVEASLSGGLLFGVPVNPPPERAVLRNFFGWDDWERDGSGGGAGAREKPVEFGCDLSLRLGPCCDGYVSVESCCLGSNSEEDSCSFGMKMGDLLTK